MKIRGHRVDLGEIDSLLLEDPASTAPAVTVPASRCAAKLRTVGFA
ncbi:hypothetical protein [Pseudonocardia nigra]|nr:hypothetical protein [Pseudonocardia nigra]